MSTLATKPRQDPQSAPGADGVAQLSAKPTSLQNWRASSISSARSGPWSGGLSGRSLCGTGRDSAKERATRLAEIGSACVSSALAFSNLLV